MVNNSNEKYSVTLTTPDLELVRNDVTLYHIHDDSTMIVDTENGTRIIYGKNLIDNGVVVIEKVD